MTVSSFPIPSSGPDTEEMLDAGVWNDVKSLLMEPKAKTWGSGSETKVLSFFFFFFLSASETIPLSLKIFPKDIQSIDSSSTSLFSPNERKKERKKCHFLFFTFHLIGNTSLERYDYLEQQNPL